METIVRAERPPQDAAETVVNDVAFDASLRVGMVVEVSWQDRSGGPTRRSQTSKARFWANAEILKINRTSVRVRLLEDTSGSSPNVYKAGTERTVQRWPWAQWPDGISPRSIAAVTIWKRDATRLPEDRWVRHARIRCATQALLDATLEGIEEDADTMWTFTELP